ncbi:DNA repair protein RecN [Aliamphritea ceti]|uniref:DNA repair protein RecN n=1 Tax=Aliamphritea ceti TaxID=1524258 RepID=UPI0021C2AD8E|nr:DNA repair protein RecN [Aliamphritea ceti]
MLTQLNIRNYAIVEQLDLELHNGMTVVSGETGAGKSIMLDALGLALGKRADSGTVRNGAERAEITADFDISQIPTARDWLIVQELNQDDQCILRRVVTAEGRSRCYINGTACPIAKVRQLGEYLIEIHGQHEHQRLLKKDHHRHLLDAFSGETRLVKQTRQQYKQWRLLDQKHKTLSQQNEEQAARVQLLSYQVEELETLQIQSGEFESLVSEQQTLANAGEIIQTGQQLLQITQDGEGGNCLNLLNQCQHLLSNMKAQSPSIRQTMEMLTSAQIQIEEASQEMNQYLGRVELNPERQLIVEDRLSSLFDLARKHRIAPEELSDHLSALQAELADLSMSDQELDALEQQAQLAQEGYYQLAERLSEVRERTARKLNKQVNKQLHDLGMPAANLDVQLTAYEKGQLNPNGLEEIEFLISTNKGQPARSLHKIASGGELSRISLAIQVITAQSASTPSLIFDEVDVGIGGAIAEVVGRLLRQLGGHSQVLCVTHQPQVASQGHQHLFVSKRAGKKHTHTQINMLSSDERVEEVARMLGGIDVTNTSREHAKEMLSITRPH